MDYLSKAIELCRDTPSVYHVAVVYDSVEDLQNAVRSVEEAGYDTQWYRSGRLIYCIIGKTLFDGIYVVAIPASTTAMWSDMKVMWVDDKVSSEKLSGLVQRMSAHNVPRITFSEIDSRYAETFTEYDPENELLDEFIKSFV